MGLTNPNLKSKPKLCANQSISTPAHPPTPQVDVVLKRMTAGGLVGEDPYVDKDSQNALFSSWVPGNTVVWPL